MSEETIVRQAAPTLAGIKTGNTAAMADLVLEGMKSAGADAELILRGKTHALKSLKCRMRR